jgi:hypothetical protein
VHENTREIAEEAKVLIIMLEDADGRIFSGKFVSEEGTLSTFETLAEVLKIEVVSESYIMIG